MKKHDEGYTLPLVMVVLLVLAIVAVTIMTTSMNNMLRQQDFIEQMQDQYAAQGEIEKIVAQLKNGEEVQVTFKDGTLAINEAKTSLTGIIVAQSGDVTIECGVAITGDRIEESASGYKIAENLDIKYTSYEIIKGGGS